MKPFLNALAVLCAAGFVVSAVAALVLFNVEQRAFNPATYQAALLQQNFYARAPALLGQLLAQNAQSRQVPLLSQLSADNWTTLISDLVPAAQIQRFTEEGITQILAYLNGETTQAHLTLAPLKQALAGPRGVKAVMDVIHAQAPCSAAQLAQMAMSFGSVLCDPPQPILDIARPAVQAELSAASSLVPDQVTILQGDPQSEGLRNLRALRLLMRLSPLLPLLFLLGITACAVRSLRGWLAWWGWPLSLAGILGTLSALSGAPLLRAQAENLVSRQAAIQVPPELAAALRAAVEAAFRRMLQGAVWEGLTLSLLGLAAGGTAALLAARAHTPPADPSEAKTQVF